MNHELIPTPVNGLVQSGPAEWWQVLAALGPLAILVSALLATAISWWTLRQRTAADALALAQKRESDAGALKQKTEADNRNEWWKRAQWAIDSSLADDPDRAKVGLGLMDVLAGTAPGAEELRIITIAWEDPLEVAAQRIAAVDGGQKPGQEGTSAEEKGRRTAMKQEPDREQETTGSSHRSASYDRGVQIAAAKLRCVTDSRLGQATPEWIKELAAEKPQQRAS